MFTLKFLWTLVFVLAAATNIQGATSYIYTFEFDAFEDLPAGIIQYEGEHLPSNIQLTSLQYVAGNLNGCTPSIIEAYFHTSTSIYYGPSGGESADCEGVPSGVAGFQFYVDNAFSPGTFPTTSAGRGIANGNVVLFHYTSGSLEITEDVRPGPQPSVPEPHGAMLICGALLFLPFLRTRIT